MADPYAEYGVMDFLTDIPYSEGYKFLTRGHQTTKRTWQASTPSTQSKADYQTRL